MQVFPHTPSKVKKPTAARPEGQEAHINSIALKAKSPQQHALKGQKLLAQGIALGIMAISKAPCKGKSFENCLSFKAFALTGRQVCERNNPGRCPGLRASALSGRAAYRSFCPFRACGAYLRNLNNYHTTLLPLKVTIKKIIAHFLSFLLLLFEVYTKLRIFAKEFRT